MSLPRGVLRAACLVLSGAGIGASVAAHWPKPAGDRNHAATAGKGDEPPPNRTPPDAPPAPPEPSTDGRTPGLARVATTADDLRPLLGLAEPVTYHLRGGRGVYLITMEANRPHPGWPEHSYFAQSRGWVGDGNRLTIIPFPNGTLPDLDIRTPPRPKGEVFSYVHVRDEKTGAGHGETVPLPTDHLVGNRAVAVEARDSLDGKPGDRVVLFQAYLMEARGQQPRPTLTSPKLLGLRREGQPNAVRLTVYFLFLWPDADDEAEAKRFEQDTADVMFGRQRGKQ